MIPVSACSRLLGTLSAMPSIGVQGLSQQNSALLQRVSIQQQRLYSASSAGRSGRGFEEHRARFSTSPIRSFVRLSAGIGIAGCCLYESTALAEDSDNINVNENCSQDSDCEFVGENKKSSAYIENLLHNHAINDRWDAVTRLINEYDFPIKCLEEILLKAIEYDEYDFVAQHIGKYEWSSEFIDKFVFRAFSHQQYRFVKFFIETGKLSPQKSIRRFALKPSSETNFDYEDSLLYLLLLTGSLHRNAKGQISKETWDFVAYLLEKGAGFLQIENGFPATTTGEKCLSMLFDMHSSINDIWTLIKLSNGNLGPGAILLLEIKKDYYEKNMNSESYRDDIKKIIHIKSFIAELSKLGNRIQE